jgi:hypothetical protein
MPPADKRGDRRPLDRRPCRSGAPGGGGLVLHAGAAAALLPTSSIAWAADTRGMRAMVQAP